MQLNFELFDTFARCLKDEANLRNGRKAVSTCISKIRKHVASLPPGALFSTQECVQYGSRSAVDQSIYLLIELNIIDRIVRGVFVAVKGRKREYSAEEVATVKARAFGNFIVQTGASCAKEHGLKAESDSVDQNFPKNEQPHSFSTSGHSTRFRFGEGYIYLRKCNGRKIHLSDSHVGKTIRALWHVQQSALTVEAIYAQILSFDRSDFLELVSKARFMPAWLRDKITSAFSIRWQRLVFEQTIMKRELCLIGSG